MWIWENKIRTLGVVVVAVLAVTITSFLWPRLIANQQRRKRSRAWKNLPAIIIRPPSDIIPLFGDDSSSVHPLLHSRGYAEVDIGKNCNGNMGNLSNDGNDIDDFNEVPHLTFGTSEKSSSSEAAHALSRVEVIALLNCLIDDEDPLMESALVTLANAAAFTENQNLIREVDTRSNNLVERLRRDCATLRQRKTMNGCDEGWSLPSHIKALTTTIGNLSVNEENQKWLQACVPALIELIACAFEEGGPKARELLLGSLEALTNLSVISSHPDSYENVVETLYQLVNPSTRSCGLEIQLQALRVLVNLSCSLDMVPHLLATKGPQCSIELLSIRTDDRLLRRWLTFLRNLVKAVQDLSLTGTSLPKGEQVSLHDTMYSTIYGVNNNGLLKGKVFLLCTGHNDPEIRELAVSVYTFLS